MRTAAKTKSLWILLLTTALGLSALASAAQPGDRQTINFSFDQTRPGSPTAVRLDIDYVNPDDPNAKPPAVQTVIEHLAPGSRIDTSVPERCGASNSELMEEGASACPPRSRVGEGTVTLDTGFPGPTRLIETEVIEFNNKDEIILLFESSGVRIVSRAAIENGRTIVTQAPPIPGGPPDGFTAIKQVRLSLERITTGNGTDLRSYITTPPSCPPGRSWANEIKFTYRDGQLQTATTRNPCRPEASDHRPPRVHIGRLPKQCASDHFVVRIVIGDQSTLRRAVVKLDGQVQRRSARKRFGVGVPAGQLSPGRHRLLVVARDRAGNVGRGSERFLRCAE